MATLRTGGNNAAEFLAPLGEVQRSAVAGQEWHELKCTKCFVLVRLWTWSENLIMH